ncbi:fimbrial biogenesis chaperone [Enterobacter ludwigii]
MKVISCMALVAVCCFSFTATASPVIGIGSMYDVLTPDLQSITKRIYNTGDSTAFVRVELLEIKPGRNNGGAEVAQKGLTGTTPERNRLIVTPQRLIIPPAGFQAVRILWPGDRGSERYFRVRFTPVMPETDDSFGLDNKAMSEYRKNTLHAGLNVLTGYGTIVIVQPGKPQFNTVIDSAGATGITIKNNGNSTVSLDNIRQCKTANTDCGAVTREFILPGRTHTVGKKAGYKTNFTLIEGNNKRELSY